MLNLGLNPSFNQTVIFYRKLLFPGKCTERRIRFLTRYFDSRLDMEKLIKALSIAENVFQSTSSKKFKVSLLLLRLMIDSHTRI